VSWGILRFLLELVDFGESNIKVGCKKRRDTKIEAGPKVDVSA
jgi:hypothetical protein